MTKIVQAGSIQQMLGGRNLIDVLGKILGGGGGGGDWPRAGCVQTCPGIGYRQRCRRRRRVVPFPAAACGGSRTDTLFWYDPRKTTGPVPFIGDRLMPDFVVTVSVPSRTKAKNVLVLDADDGFHAQVAAYMFVTQPLRPPADVLDITCATGDPNRPPSKIDAQVSARIYNPNPYRDFPGQRDKLDGDNPPREQAYMEQGAAIVSLGEKIVGLHHCIKGGHNEDALGHLFDLLHHVAPDLTVRDSDGEPVVVGLEDLAKAYGEHPAPLKEAACESG